MSATTWSKFYWADWRSEPALRMVGLAARGLWMEMLSLMAEAEPRGHLVHNGKPPTSEQLAILVGASVKQVRTLIVELEAAGVFTRQDDGAIISRRMVRDAERAEKGREAVGRRQDRQPEPTREPTRSPARSGLGNLLVPPGNNQPPITNNQLPDSESRKASQENAGALGERSGSEPKPDPLDPPAFMDRRLTAPNMKFVKGGAQQFAGIGPMERPKKNPARADQHLAEHMISTGHLPAEQVWLVIMAARDESDPNHIDAARQCEKYSRTHKLGWFHEEAVA